jgi:uncharacterized membrane protein
VNALLMAGVGVAISHAGHRLVDPGAAKPPVRLYFLQGFLHLGAGVMAVGVVSCMLFALAGAYDSDYLTSEYLPYFLLLGFSEAWLSGMLSTLFAVYRPELLADFEDAQFFGRR